MKIQVRLFALAKQVAGTESVSFELPPGATVADLRDAFEVQFPDLQAVSRSVRFAVNRDFASDDTELTPEDDVACIPPVSGG